jgi:hypothetical protein
MSWTWWYMTVIPGTQKVETEGPEFKANLGNSYRDPISKTN